VVATVTPGVVEFAVGSATANFTVRPLTVGTIEIKGTAPGYDTASGTFLVDIAL
jgi:hypothetical protein